MRSAKLLFHLKIVSGDFCSEIDVSAIACNHKTVELIMCY